MKLPTMAVAAGIATLAVAVPFAEGANKTVTVKNFKYTPATVTHQDGRHGHLALPARPRPAQRQGLGRHQEPRADHHRHVPQDVHPRRHVPLHLHDPPEHEGHRPRPLGATALS